MKLILIRHGEPDYATDSLTEEGKKQAAAAAKRLQNEGIDRIFTSPKGRAKETAAATAELLGLPVETLDFMAEVGWKNATDHDIPWNGHPWRNAEQIVRDGKDLLDGNWRETTVFADTVLPASSAAVEKGAEEWFAELGFVREGDSFRCVKKSGNDRTYALFSHGGSSSVLLSYVLGLPLPYILYSVRPHFSAITILEFPENEGELVRPLIRLLNDSAHITPGNLFYGQ